MRLTQFTDLALRLMVHLARNEGTRITIAEAAASCSVSRFHLMKVVNHLARCGLIRTTKGRTGSITLSQPASETTIGHIVRAAEEDFSLVECQSGTECRMLPDCTIPLALSGALNAFFAELDSRTLADLVAAPTFSSLEGSEPPLHPFSTALRSTSCPPRRSTKP